MFTILVVEDNQKLQKLFCTVLTKNDYKAIGADDGQAALDILDTTHIDMMITDVMMPNIDGYELIQELRDANYDFPILIITAKDDYNDKKKGFSAGTDDYMVKPINVNEMVLRVGALLKRAQSISDRKIMIGETELDYDSLTISFNDQAIELPQKEFYLLYKLAASPNKIFTRQQLMDEIWGVESESYTQTIDVHINRLRNHLKENADFKIVTVRGLGYKVVKA